MAANLWQRLTSRVLYTPDEVMNLAVALLAGSVGYGEIMDAMAKIEGFNAGAIDPALTRAIEQAFGDMADRDRADDRAVLARLRQRILDGTL
jgi:hypothetical protein